MESCVGEEAALGDILNGSFTAYINQDAAIIAQDFREAYSSVVHRTKKPNVLVVGPTGSGKSSLINSVFGMDLAQAGTGVPITTNFKCYELPGSPVCVYDSKGVEHGHGEEFLSSAKEFFALKHVGDPDPQYAAETIHVIWYVINSAGSRIHPFEIQLWQTLFKNLPIMFMINKADISTDEDRSALKQTVENLNLPNSLGCFETVSGNHFPMLNLTICPHCGSDDLHIRKQQKLATCETCHQQTSLLVTSQHDIVAKTLHILPGLVRDAFIQAQIISCSHKEHLAKREIQRFYSCFAKIRLPSTMVNRIAELLVWLARLWHFVENGSVVGEEIAKDLFKAFSFKEKLLVFLRQGNGERIHIVGLGILWNRCLRHLFLEIFLRSASIAPCDTSWEKTVKDCFAELTEETLLQLEKSIADFGLETVLENEMPTQMEFHPSWANSHSPLQLPTSPANIQHTHTTVSNSPPLKPKQPPNFSHSSSFTTSTHTQSPPNSGDEHNS
ncbi:GTP binding protein [Pelomyxa schiedti]|nr:GTP binding protein [Pelomyxa schiedti]